MSITKKAIWEEEGDHFWQQLTFQEEDRHLHTSAPWDGVTGGFDRRTWSAWRNIVDADLDQYRTPALAKVTIFEVAERPWGWLTTSAEVDDRIYVGSKQWRDRMAAAKSNERK